MGERVKFTVPRVEGFKCPEGVAQAFLWSSTVPALALRVTANGARAYVFQARYAGQTVRMTIGSPKAWSIDDAHDKARELQRLIDEGIDPRTQKAEREAAEAKKRQDEQRASVTVRDAWPVYMAEGKPRGKDAWKPRYRSDLEKAAAPGGEPKKRGSGKTKPGHLAPLMPLRLADIDKDVIRDWYATEKKRAPVQAARAVAMFSGFLSWCATRREFREFVDRECARSTELRDVLPPKRRRADALAVDHLAPWFVGTDKLRPVARAYLQALVLTGARREEMAALKWADIDFRWKTMRIADKVGDTRTLPLTPYLSALLGALPRAKTATGKANPYVFAATRSKSGRIAEPRSPHDRLLEAAGIPHVSIHGLRRTFALLGEAAGAPAGAIAQVQGHRPSATAEGYKPRTIDALRPFLEQIEGFILGKAGVEVPEAAPGLRLAAAGGRPV
jgi:integrase